MDTSTWKSDFDNWCQETFVLNKSTTPSVTSEYVDLVIRYLRASGEERDAVIGSMTDARRAKFRHKVKQKKYSWMIDPATTGSDEPVLTQPTKDGSGSRIVVPVEKFFDTLKGIHESTGHAKVPTMMKKLSVSRQGQNLNRLSK